MHIDDSIRENQIQKINKLKQTRNQEQASAALQQVSTAATTGSNLMPAVMDAVEKNCTLGEIADTLRQVFGEYRQ
jgi:methylmalonyl-CoA mutase N-terminal domain/subunit